MRRGQLRERPRGASWQIGYAGLMTAMMALFILLWILGSGDETREAVAAHLNHPGGSEVRDTDRLNEDWSMGGREHSLERERLAESATLMVHALSNSPAVSRAMDRVSIDFVPQGLQFQLHESPGASSMLDAGPGEPGGDTRAILEIVSRILAILPNGIVIEGHTDGRPPSASADYGNWELSSARANSARRILESAGVGPERIIRVIGYADRRPAVPDDPLDARNHRITLIILYRGASVN